MAVGLRDRGDQGYAYGEGEVMSADAATFDFAPAYRAEGYGAIAWRVTGYAQEWTQESWEWIGGDDDDPEDEFNYVYYETEQYDDTSRVIAHMIGDDRDFTFDVSDLEPIAREDYCGECGQIGCSHDGYDR